MFVFRSWCVKYLPGWSLWSHHRQSCLQGEYIFLFIKSLFLFPSSWTGRRLRDWITNQTKATRVQCSFRHRRICEYYMDKASIIIKANKLDTFIHLCRSNLCEEGGIYLSIYLSQYVHIYHLFSLSLKINLGISIDIICHNWALK